MHCSTFLSRPLEHGNCTAALDELPVFEVFLLLLDVKLCWEISATHPVVLRAQRVHEIYVDD